MTKELEVNVDGTTILIEPEPVYGSQKTSATSKAIEQTGDALEKAKETVIVVAKSMVGALKNLDKTITPDEFTMEFGLKFNAEGNAVVTKVGAEATLKITMKYVHTKE